MQLLLLLLWIACIQANTEKAILHVNQVPSIPCQSNSHVLLSPPFTQIQQSLIPSSKAIYVLDHLEYGSKYEIRISYPAITPADFDIHILNGCQQQDGIAYLIQISANYTGISTLQGIASHPITFHLVLETLYLGFLFYQVYRIVMTILFMLLIGYFILPFIRQRIVKIVKDDAFTKQS
ncbi:uncharacterized protein B0P05DRAFT_529546 [Gilbertella persicaria]|uniref:uncharacterized protein n=1 Tax=Gilbertella persicaria TaxID=101096 RepID=UPI00221E6D1A|nr:uncharacterized protein B0P05DRAFT_529546 [Gilbertella persicaria]KAI8090145.1 hypothetical protein B0P05DRAFT_529546 [Gilbertella persicaria]